MESGDPEIKEFIHGLNSQAFNLNKGLVQKSGTMQDIKLHKDIYGVPASPSAATPSSQSQVSQAIPQQVNTDPALLNNLIERVSSVEQQITKFVNLIQKQVARNAKEINIRIKLDNASTNKE